MPKIRELQISGTPYQMGLQHGQAYPSEIRTLTEDRIQLCSDPLWSGYEPSRQTVLQLAEKCLPAHWDYAPESMEQLQGVADTTGLSLAELVITNGFTDFVDYVASTSPIARPDPIPGPYAAECTTFMIAAKFATDGQALIGQTWDMHASALPHIVLLRARPDDGPAFIAFTLTGCVGMLGMNEAGISVCINNLVAAEGQPGVTWPFVARKILAQTTLEDALKCITSAPLAGGHNYLIADAEGRGYNIEAMPSVFHIDTLREAPLTHANRCTAERTQVVESVLSESWTGDSDTRAGRASAFLDSQWITPETLMALTRDRSDGENSVCSYPDPPYHTQTCCAAIMRPATRDFWGVWGLPDENEYEHYVVN